MYQKVPVTITEPQFKKLIRGYPVQLSAGQLLPHHKHHVIVHPLMAQKMHKAVMKGTGVRLQMSPHEVEMTGAGWGDLWNSIKRGATAAYNWGAENIPKAINYVKENVIDTPFYQQNIRPKLREKLEEFAETKPYAGYSVPAIEYLGDRTGAFGVKKRGTRPKPKAKRSSSGGSFRV
jgi:hypothetical protein